jgi:hypothetical protein
MKQARNHIFKIMAIVLLACLIFLVLGYLFFSSFVTTVQVLPSPDSTHKAVLKRLDGIDLVFFVSVDGRKVYSSPDFRPNSKVVFGEKLIWDKTGNIVVLEVTGKRLFGYNVQTHKAISDAELLSLEYSPELDEWEYGFEGTWPEERIEKQQQ